MGRRPICVVCLLLMSAMCLMDALGISVIRGNPLPRSLQTWIGCHQEAVIFGEVQQCAETEFSQSIYLKGAFLLCPKKGGQGAESVRKISIENVRVFLKKEKVNTSGNIPAGTFLKVSGRLVPVPEARNPGEFDSRQYYGCRHIYYFLKDGVIEEQSAAWSPYLQGLLDVREKFAGIYAGAAGEDAPVFEAMVLGEKGSLEEETKMRYQMAGIIHILAISGMHISLLGAGINRLLKRAGLGLVPAGMISLVLMVQYGMMTGSSVAAMRAVCMFFMAVSAELLGRCYDGLTALAVSAILLLFNAPSNLYSSGFLLSFGAVVGLGTVAPVVSGVAGKKGKMVKTLLGSLAVQMVNLPVMLYFYGEVSLMGIFLNLAVLPTVGAVLACGVLGGLAGLLSMRAAEIILIPGRVLLFLYEQLCRLAGKLPWCTWIGGQPELWQILGYYGFLFLALFLGKTAMKRRKKGTENKHRGKILRHFPGKLEMGMLLLVCLGVFILGWRSEKNLKITCLDVGQGDGIVIETPEGYHFLVDCGSSNKSNVGQYQLLPYLKSQGISYLDGIFVSHTDEDHISGIKELLTYMGEGLTSIHGGTLYLPGWSQPPDAWEELAALAKEAGMKTTGTNAGDRIKAGELSFAVLSPVPGASGQDVNEEAMVLELEYKDFRGLCTGDIGEETEKKLLKEGRLSDVDFLKVGHHGSRYSSGKAFLETILPEIGVISCSAANTYGHPSPEAIKRLEDSGCRLEYTMKSGAVTLRTNGTRIWTERFCITS